MKTILLSLGLVLGTCAITGCAGTATRQSTGEYIDNTAIMARVKAAFASDELVKARDIQVEAYRGTVQLSGFVENDAQKSRAAQIAGSIEGVREVKNNIIIR